MRRFSWLLAVLAAVLVLTQAPRAHAGCENRQPGDVSTQRCGGTTTWLYQQTFNKGFTLGKVCRNATGGTLVKGTLVSINNTTSWSETYKAWLPRKADADAGIPATHILTADLANNTTGTCYSVTRVTGVATNGTTVGDRIYLSATVGTFTPTAPTAANSFVQPVCTVAVVHASAGEIECDLTQPITVIGSGQLQTDSVTATAIVTDGVDSAEIKANAVGNAELGDDAVGLAEMAAGTAGNLITYDASGNPAAVATGSAGQVLTSNGAGAAPTFQASPAPATPINLCFLYDFAVLGGAQGALTMTKCADGTAQTLPDNAVILRVTQESDTDLTSGGGATVALGYTGNDNAFLAATAYTDASFDVDAIAARNAEVPIITGAAVSVLATVATADLTAGKFKLYVEYIQGD